MLFEPTLDQIYHNESGLSFKLSNWKIGRIYKAILKWLTNKIDAFSSSGISIKILEDLYIKTNDLLTNDTSNAQNQLILTILQKYMRTLSEKYEDFESKKDEESDALYNFDQPKHAKQSSPYSQKHTDSEQKNRTLKNNFMSGGQENSSHPQKDQEDNPDIERRPDGGEYTEESDEEERQHPLKGKLMESFDEINRSTTKGQTSKIISFVVLILSEPSVKDPEEGFFLKISEYAEIVAILSKILKQNEVDPMVISSVFEKLKPIAIFDGSQNT